MQIVIKKTFQNIVLTTLKIHYTIYIILHIVIYNVCQLSLYKTGKLPTPVQY